MDIQYLTSEWLLHPILLSILIGGIIFPVITLFGVLCTLPIIYGIIYPYLLIYKFLEDEWYEELLYLAWSGAWIGMFVGIIYTLSIKYHWG